MNLSWLFVLLLNSLPLLKHENLPFEIRFKCVRWFCSNLEGSGGGITGEVAQVSKVEYVRGAGSVYQMQSRRIPCLQLLCTDFLALLSTEYLIKVMHQYNWSIWTT